MGTSPLHNFMVGSQDDFALSFLRGWPFFLEGKEGFLSLLYSFRLQLDQCVWLIVLTQSCSVGSVDLVSFSGNETITLVLARGSYHRGGPEKPCEKSSSATAAPAATSVAQVVIGRGPSCSLFASDYPLYEYN